MTTRAEIALYDHAAAHSNPEKADTLRYAAQVVLFKHSDIEAVHRRRTVKNVEGKK